MASAAIRRRGQPRRCGGRDKSALVGGGRTILERAVVPRTDRGYHPVCVVCTRARRPTVSQRLAPRMLATVGLIETGRARVIEPEDVECFGPGRRLLADVNTPGEFDELEALLGHKL
jgi:molybdopterin-guanine dinucleotide biosynthesis protein A